MRRSTSSRGNSEPPPFVTPSTLPIPLANYLQSLTPQTEASEGKAMFSKSLARAANRSCAQAATGTSTSTTSAAACFTARRNHHQRRHSSSKASSCPPGHAANDGKAAAEEKAAIAEPTTQESHQPQQQRGAKRVTRTKRSRPAAVPDKQEDQFAGLPAVPGMHMSNSGTLISDQMSWVNANIW